tara:strand:+ start:279 stop:827 length:549 start_codon:yes stop_codon:yes gene_type:complete
MSLISLNKISAVTSNIVKIKWFKNVGKEIDANLYSSIKNYCQELNISSEIKQITTWEKAIKVINSKDWNKACWDIEEKEKESLLNILLENENEKKVFSFLKSLTEESSKIIDTYSIKDLNKNNIKYQYYSKVAAGAAAICCYQAALAFASNQNANHIFITKYELFKSGHWPLIVKNNVFNIF